MLQWFYRSFTNDFVHNSKSYLSPLCTRFMYLLYSFLLSADFLMFVLTWTTILLNYILEICDCLYVWAACLNLAGNLPENEYNFQNQSKLAGWVPVLMHSTFRYFTFDFQNIFIMVPLFNQLILQWNTKVVPCGPSRLAPTCSHFLLLVFNSPYQARTCNVNFIFIVLELELEHDYGTADSLLRTWVFWMDLSAVREKKPWDVHVFRYQTFQKS